MQGIGKFNPGGYGVGLRTVDQVEGPEGFFSCMVLQHGDRGALRAILGHIGLLGSQAWQRRETKQPGDNGGEPFSWQKVDPGK